MNGEQLSKFSSAENDNKVKYMHPGHCVFSYRIEVTTHYVRCIKCEYHITMSATCILLLRASMLFTSNLFIKAMCILLKQNWFQFVFVVKVTATKTAKKIKILF